MAHKQPKKVISNPHIKEVIKHYLEVDGATEMGAYRDAITDILHMAFQDKKLRKEWMKSDKGVADNDNWDATLKDNLVWGAYGVFEDEREQNELSLLNSIKKSDLPLYVDYPWEFEGTQYEFEERLKNAKSK